MYAGLFQPKHFILNRLSTVYDAGERKRSLHLAYHRPSLLNHSLRQLRKIRSSQTQEVSLNFRNIKTESNEKLVKQSSVKPQPREHVY